MIHVLGEQMPVLFEVQQIALKRLDIAGRRGGKAL